MNCSNSRWRLLKVRCNNGSSAIVATTTIITTSSSSWPTLQRQQHSSSSSKQVFCVALLCQPKYPSARAPDWLCAGICIAFARPPSSFALVWSFARRGFFGNLALLHKFQRPTGPGQRSIRHVWLPLLLLGACCFRCRWLRLNDLLFVCFVSI